MENKRKNIIYLLSSFLLACFLFINATTSSYQKSTTTKLTTSENYTNILNDVPINIKYDSNQYFISGFSSTATVSLTGSNRLLLQQETNESTRNFSVVADITDYDSGEVTTELMVENLPSGVTATLSPVSIAVKIGHKASQTFDLETQVPLEQVAEGLVISDITVTDKKIKVTSDEETLARITRVVAILPSNIILDKNYAGTVTLLALDDEGNALPSVISPSETHLKINIKEKTESKSSSSSSSKS